MVAIKNAKLASGPGKLDESLLFQHGDGELLVEFLGNSAFRMAPDIAKLIPTVYVMTVEHANERLFGKLMPMLAKIDRLEKELEILHKHLDNPNDL